MIDQVHIEEGGDAKLDVLEVEVTRKHVNGRYWWIFGGGGLEVGWSDGMTTKRIKVGCFRGGGGA